MYIINQSKLINYNINSNNATELMFWHNSDADSYGQTAQETDNHPNYKQKHTTQIREYTNTQVQYSTTAQTKIRRGRVGGEVTVLTQPNKNTNNKSNKKEKPI